MRRKLQYIFLAVTFLLIHLNTFGQKQKPKNDSWYDEKALHFGFSLGLNMMDFNITPTRVPFGSDTTYLNPEVNILNPGINIQIVMNMRPGKYFDFRFLPGVSFGQRNVRYYSVLDSLGVSVFGETYNDRQRIESSFLEFPFLLKYKGDRLNNARPYVIGGINFRYDLAGKKEYDDEKPVYLRVKRADLYYELGAGLDFYLPYFKFSVELKMSNGIRDIVVHDPAPGYPQYANAIERMRSQIWIIAFHFE
ncbi:MAG: porin family protein [Bacteroidales bacterium]